jgi:transketolase
MRNTIARKMTEYAAADKQFMILSADLGYSVFNTFSKQNPDRFYNAGIAENTMVGVAAGLAMGGKKVFVYSISTFLAEKCFEQIREDVCYHDLPLVLIGTGAGFAYGQAGFTHWSNEDIGCLRTIPNLAIVSPSDPGELAMLLDESLTYPHPIYFRVGKNGESTFTRRNHLRIGEAYYIHEEKDIALVTHGNIIEEVVAAREMLKKDGFSVSLISSPTIQPFDKLFFDNLAKTHKHIYVVEEHSVVGGLGDALNYLAPVKIAVESTLLYEGGDLNYLRKQAKIDTASIYQRILQDMRK